VLPEIRRKDRLSIFGTVLVTQRGGKSDLLPIRDRGQQAATIRRSPSCSLSSIGAPGRVAPDPDRFWTFRVVGRCESSTIRW
jgi:hypothetical protein